MPKAQRVILERTADSKAYFLSRLDKPEVKIKSTHIELKRLCEHIAQSAAEPEFPKFRPVYDRYQIANVLDREIAAYRQDWSAAELSSYHWKIMQALTNWIGHAYSDGYPKRNLYPAQDLAERIVSAISIELDSPAEWKPRSPENPDEESRILNAIRSEVGKRIDAHCREILVQDPRTGFWLPAYEDISGPGTKARRARAVARILEDRAQLPNESLGKFANETWAIVQTSIQKVCSSDEEAQTQLIGDRPVAARDNVVRLRK